MDGNSRGLEWEAAYAEHASRLVRLATVLVGANDARDLVTDAVRRAVHSRQWPALADEGAYLTTTLVNEARQFHRSRSRRTAREARAQRLVVESTSDLPDLDVRDALGVLSAQQLAVVFLTYWEDLSIPAVAAALDVSEGSVRKQLFRAKQKLAEVLR